MPREEVELDQRTRELLERIRVKNQMETVEEVAEMLLRRRLMRATRTLTGRGRALHVVAGRRS